MLSTYTDHATTRTRVAHDLHDVDDLPAALELLDAMHAMSPDDLARVLVACFESGDLVDRVARAGFRSVAAHLVDARRLRESLSLSRGLADDLARIADDMVDACDGFDSVGVRDVRAWSDRLADIGAAVEHAAAETDSALSGDLVESAMESA